MTFDKMTIRARLTATFGVLAVLVLLVATLSLKSLADTNDRFSTFVLGINARAMLADDVRTAVDRRAIAVRNLVLVTKPEDLAAEKAAVVQAHEDVQTRLARLQEMAQSPGVPDTVREMIGNIHDVEQSYGPIALAIVKLALDGKRDEAIAKMNEDCRPHLAALIKATEAYRSLTIRREERQIEQEASVYATQRNLLVTACLSVKSRVFVDVLDE